MKFCLLLLISYTFLLLSACSSQREDCIEKEVNLGEIGKDWIYRNNDFGVTFNLPVGWIYLSKNKIIRVGTATDSIVLVNQKVQIKNLTHSIMSFASGENKEGTDIFSLASTPRDSMDSLNVRISLSAWASENHDEKKDLDDFREMMIGRANKQKKRIGGKYIHKFEMSEYAGKRYMEISTFFPADDYTIKEQVFLFNYRCYNLCLIISYIDKEISQKVVKEIYENIVFDKK